MKRKIIVATLGFALLSINTHASPPSTCSQIAGTWTGNATVKFNLDKQKMSCIYQTSTNVTADDPNGSSFTAVVSLTLTSGICQPNATITQAGTCVGNGTIKVNSPDGSFAIHGKLHDGQTATIDGKVNFIVNAQTVHGNVEKTTLTKV